MQEVPRCGKRQGWRRSGVRLGGATEAVSAKEKEKERKIETRIELFGGYHGMLDRREKDSTETSCNRKRRFSGSHSRHPLSRLCQPPPFDVPLFRSFRSADSRVPLLVSLAARLADYTSAYITTALRQFDSSIRDCEAYPPALFSVSTFSSSSSSSSTSFVFRYPRSVQSYVTIQRNCCTYIIQLLRHH